MSSLPGFSKWRYKTRRRGRRSLVFWKAPGFSVGTVKPVNMIDEERDACPALLAHITFVRYAHFLYFQSENYTYRFLKFGVVLTASSRLRWCVLSSQFLGGARSGLNGWVFSCFILASTCSHAAFSRLHGEYSRRRFLFVHPLLDSVFDRHKCDVLAALPPLNFCVCPII